MEVSISQVASLGNPNPHNGTATTYFNTNAKMRKRTKTGCLTCRKRRIKCGEERPTCSNCIKSNRLCEGYNQRVVFKQPIGDWPNHPGVVSTLPYHSSMLLGMRPYSYKSQLDNPDHSPALSAGFPEQWSDISTPSSRPFFEEHENRSVPYSPPIHSNQQRDQAIGVTSGTPTASSDTPSLDMGSLPPLPFDHGEVAEYLDDDYWDVLSDDDSAICIIEEPSPEKLAFIEKIKPIRQTFRLDFLESALDQYRPHHTANPLKDPRVAQIFSFFIHVTGPSLSNFNLSYDGIFWAESLPRMALNNLSLLHAMLALATLHVAYIRKASATPSFKHYAYSLKRFARALGRPNARLHPSTLAASLLLSIYEVLAGDHSKWMTHLRGATELLREVQHCLPDESVRDTHSFSSNFVDSTLDASSVSIMDLPHSKELYNNIFWAFSKHDAFYSIISESEPMMPTEFWLQNPPRSSAKLSSIPYHDKLQIILLRIAEYAAQERKRKGAMKTTGWATHVFSSGVEYSQALLEWNSIENSLRALEDELPAIFQPLDGSLVPAAESPFGKPIYHRSYDISNFFLNLQMCYILLLRNHPSQPPGMMIATYTAAPKTKLHALHVGKLVAGMNTHMESRPLHPSLQGSLLDCAFPLFVAALQFQDQLQREWTVKTFREITTYAGWAYPEQACLAVQRAWERNGMLERGPPWTIKPSTYHAVDISTLFPQSTFTDLFSELDQKSSPVDISSNVQTPIPVTPKFDAKSIPPVSDSVDLGSSKHAAQPEERGSLSYDQKGFRRRSSWTQDEDSWLLSLITRNGPHNWVRIAQEIGRSPKQCRERYHQNLKPTLNHEPFMPEDQQASEGAKRKLVDLSGDCPKDTRSLPTLSVHSPNDIDPTAAIELGGSINLEEDDATSKTGEAMEHVVLNPQLSTPGEIDNVTRRPIPTSPTDSRDVKSMHLEEVLTESSVPESDVSVSTEAEDEKALLELKRKKVVDRVMEYFHTIFRAMSPIRRRENSESDAKSSTTGHRGDPSHANSQSPAECRHSITTYGNTGESSSTVIQGGSTNYSASTQESSMQSATKLGKRPRQDDDGNDGEEDGAPSKRPREDAEISHAAERKRKFACPYFKRNAERYLMRRSCVGPGWEEVRRVKEHLYRNHALPFFCPRCYEIFKTETLLHDHQRAEEPCKRRPTEVIEGFDKLQERQLRSRKKTLQEPSEVDKWKEMYRILFPSDDEAMMPSPYLDADWEKVYQKGRPSVPNELARYEQFLRRELPPAVRRELEVAVEREFSPMEERLKSQLIDIVRDLQLQLFRSYTQSRNAPSAPAEEATQASPLAHDTAHSGPSSSFNNMASSTAPMRPEHIATESPSTTTIQEELASFEPAPPLIESVSDWNFDPVLFPFHEFGYIGGAADSAYGSLFSEPSYLKYEFDNGLGYHDPSLDNGEGPSGTN